MIRKYTFGNPFPTDAVVLDLPAETAPLNSMETQTDPEGRLVLRLSLAPEEVIFGLGQNVRGIDKRGHRYESWNSDIFNHTEERPSLWSSSARIASSGSTWTIRERSSGISAVPDMIRRRLPWRAAASICTCWKRTP